MQNTELPRDRYSVEPSNHLTQEAAAKGILNFHLRFSTVSRISGRVSTSPTEINSDALLRYIHWKPTVCSWCQPGLPAPPTAPATSSPDETNPEGRQRAGTAPGPAAAPLLSAVRAGGARARGLHNGWVRGCVPAARPSALPAEPPPAGRGGEEGGRARRPAPRRAATPTAAEQRLAPPHARGLPRLLAHPATTGGQPAKRGEGTRGGVLAAASRPPPPPPPPNDSGTGYYCHRPLTLFSSAATSSHCQPRSPTTRPLIGPLRLPTSPALIGRYLLRVSSSAPPARLPHRSRRRRSVRGAWLAGGATGASEQQRLGEGRPSSPGRREGPERELPGTLVAGCASGSGRSRR